MRFHSFCPFQGNSSISALFYAIIIYFLLYLPLLIYAYLYFPLLLLPFAFPFPREKLFQKCCLYSSTGFSLLHFEPISFRFHLHQASENCLFKVINGLNSWSLPCLSTEFNSWLLSPVKIFLSDWFSGYHYPLLGCSVSTTNLPSPWLVPFLDSTNI